jgi:hypothetical protein
MPDPRRALVLVLGCAALMLSGGAEALRLDEP